MKISQTCITATAIAILLCVSAWAQDIPPTSQSKSERKAQEKAEKAKANADEKARDDAAKQAAAAAKQRLDAVTTTLKELNSFPSTFVGQTRRIASVGLDEIKEYTERGETAYLLSIKEGYDWSPVYLTMDHPFFVLTPDLARAAFQRTKDLPPGYSKVIDVWFQLTAIPDSRGTYYAAKISCITFLNWNGSASGVVGQCPSY